MEFYRSCCALVLATLACVPVARAASDVYDNNPGGDWGNGLNWEDGTMPGAGDTATFSLNQTYSVTFDNNPNALSNPVNNQDLFFSAGTVTFTSGSGGPYTYHLTGTGGDDALITGGTLTLGTSGNPLHMTVDDDLLVRGASTLNVNFGSQINTLDLLVGTIAGGGNDGTVVVDGVGSKLNSTTTTNLGLNGASGTLTYSNSAQGALSTTAIVYIGHTSNNATVGTLNVESDADVDVGTLNIGTGGTGSATGVVNVQGSGSTLDVLAASTLTVGSAAGGTGSLNIGTTTTSGATVTTGTGEFTINARGTVNIGSDTTDGTLNANGDVTIDGGLLTLDEYSTFALATGTTMTIQNGGRAIFDTFTPADATYDIIGDTSKLEASVLGIGYGAEVNVTAGGLVSSDYIMDIGDAGDGTLSVDGSGSSAEASGLVSIWGFNGGTATVSFSNDADGTFDNGIYMAVHSFAGTTANVEVLTGAELSVGNLRLATAGGLTTSATLNVQGSDSTVTQTTPSTLTVGHSTSGTATINIGTTSFGAVFNTGTGLFTINARGTVNVGSGAITGTLSANGDLTIDDGVLTRASGSTFTLASGKTMTIQNGGRASFTGDYTTTTNAIHTIGGVNSKLETLNGGALNLNDGAQVNVNAGGLLAVTGNMAIGNNGTSGTLSIQGGNSASPISFGTLTVGSASGGIGTLDIGTTTSGGMLTTQGGQITINSTGTVNIGSDTTTGTFWAYGDVMIDGGVLTRGSGSTFNLLNNEMTIQNAGRASFTGDYSTGSSSYNITGAGSTLETLGGGALILNSGGLPVDVSSGGTISSASSMDIDGTTLSVSGPGSSAIADGSSVSTWDESIVVFDNGASGSFGAIDVRNIINPYNDMYHVQVHSGADLTCGNLSLEGASAQDYVRLDLSGSGSTIALNPGASLTVGDYATIQVGFSDIGGSLTVGSGGSTTLNAGGYIVIRGGGTADLKTLTVNGGQIGLVSGSLSYIGNLTVGDGGFLFTDDYLLDITLDIDRQLTLSGTTTVDATRTLYLYGGTLNTGSLVNNGTLNFSSGTLNTGSLVNNGTLNFYNGTLGIAGDYTQSDDGTLIIHLGVDVNDFDKLQPSGTATLDGALEVRLASYEPYVPQLGDLFEIIAAGLLVSGEFDEELLLLPDLGGGLDWNVIYDTTTVTLEVIQAGLMGDYNGDGKVSAADFTVWRDNVGASTLTNRDPNNSGDVDIDDYNSWKAHYGEGDFGSGAGAIVSLSNGAAVPEPTALVLVLVGCVAVGLARSAGHGFAAVPGRG